MVHHKLGRANVCPRIPACRARWTAGAKRLTGIAGATAAGRHNLSVNSVAPAAADEYRYAAGSTHGAATRIRRSDGGAADTRAPAAPTRAARLDAGPTAGAVAFLGFSRCAASGRCVAAAEQDQWENDGDRDDQCTGQRHWTLLASVVSKKKNVKLGEYSRCCLVRQRAEQRPPFGGLIVILRVRSLASLESTSREPHPETSTRFQSC